MDERGQRRAGETRACGATVMSLLTLWPLTHRTAAQVRQLLYAGLIMKEGGPIIVPLEREFKVPNDDWAAWDASGRQGASPKKQRTIKLHGVVSQPMVPTVFTTSGLPSTSALALRALVGKPGTAKELVARWHSAEQTNDPALFAAVEQDAKARIGAVFTAFGGGFAGLEAGAAIDALCEASAVETLLTNFILPLQVRLSSRLPYAQPFD